MKKLILAVLASFSLCGLSQQATAQTAEDRHFSVGPMFTAGLATFAGDVEEGFKIKPRFAWSFGALSQLDISSKIAFNLGLAYESRARYYYLENNEDAGNVTTEMASLEIMPLFNFSNFLLGFAFRLPMSGTAISKGTTAGVSYSRNTDVTDDMKMAVEVKIGGNIPILRSEAGTLSFLVLGGYDISQPFKSVNTGFDPGQPDASLRIGLDYLFNVAHLKN
jgi:hypothetical protein